ncbi:hypothetical protein LBMAG42_28460 [Deltaproteobacteria bacterium]|nr:hypothetical protein LBMAG42_28460 [Deltaproteobacteria bacterium]
MLLLAFVGDAQAQACMCSRDVSLPSGHVARVGEVMMNLDTTSGYSGDTSFWSGFLVTDLHGDSMAGMKMSPHFVQSAKLEASVGLPKGFAVSAALPYVAMFHTEENEMPGDVDNNGIGDVSVMGRWGRKIGMSKWYLGVSGGVTLPTGEVVTNSPVRRGKGALGWVVGAQTVYRLNPFVALAASAGASSTALPTPDNYYVGAMVNGSLGARWTPKENGPVVLSATVLEEWQDTDRKDALVYENTGYLSTSLALGASWNVWAKDMRSITLQARAQSPLVQQVGDPMYQANLSGTLGVGAVVF